MELISTRILTLFGVLLLIGVLSVLGYKYYSKHEKLKKGIFLIIAIILITGPFLFNLIKDISHQLKYGNEFNFYEIDIFESYSTFLLIFVIFFSLIWYLIYLFLLYVVKSKKGLTNFFEFNIINSLVIGTVLSLIFFVSFHIIYKTTFNDFEIQINEKFADKNFIDIYNEIYEKTGSDKGLYYRGFNYLTVQVNEEGYIEDINFSFNVSKFGRGLLCFGHLTNNNTISFTYDNHDIVKYKKNMNLKDAFYNLEEIQIQDIDATLSQYANLDYNENNFNLEFIFVDFDTEQDFINNYLLSFVIDKNYSSRLLLDYELLGKYNIIKYETVSQNREFLNLYLKIN